MKLMSSKGWKSFALLLILLSLWEIIVRTAHIEAWLLPAPTAIIYECIQGWGNFYPHLFSTLKLSLFGLMIGSGFGILTAVILHRVRGIKEAIYPLLILSQNIPVIVLAPLLVIWFGFGILPKIIVITLVCFFPITIAALDGFRQTSPELKHYMVMAGASKKQIFWKLELPYSLPAIFSGLKISATYSVMGAVISEWLGAKNGLGVYMTLASSSFRTDRVFVAILWIMAMSILIFAAISFAERKIVHWQGKDDHT